MNRTILTISLCIIILNSTFAVGISSNHQKNQLTYPETQKTITIYPENLYEWADGKISGTWKNPIQTTNGQLTGYIQHGRTSYQGTFLAELQHNTNETIGYFTGKFNRFILFGTYLDKISNTSTAFIGLLKLTTTSFTALLLNPKLGILTITGVHNTSFLPMLTGPFSVGQKSMHLIDSDRPELFTEDPDDIREFMIKIWYPINHSNITERFLYMDAPTFLWLKNRSPVPLITIPNHAYRFVRPYGDIDGVLTTLEQHFPVLIFSPGYDGVDAIYTALIEDLVSHGYIVVSINHPYVSGITVFPDGQTIGLAPVPEDPDEQQQFFDMALRSVVEDAKHTLDVITTMNTSNETWQGRFDLAHVGMYGHSFGGGSTAVCCSEDSRFKAGFTLDGFFNPNLINGTIDVPFGLMLAEGRYPNETNADMLWNNLSSDGIKIGVTGSTHYGFTDVGVLLGHLLPLIPPNLLGFGTIEPRRMVNITKNLELTFFNVFLRNHHEQELLDLADHYDEVSIIIK